MGWASAAAAFAVALLFVMQASAQRSFPAGLNLYCHQKSCYDILGLPESAQKQDIKKAYRRLSLIFHPDKSDAPDAPEKFMEIATAYEVLSNDDKRKAYDDFLAHPERHIWEHYGAYYQAVYAPKSDLRVVIFGIVAVISAIHYVSVKTRRGMMRSRILEQQRTKLWVEKRIYELAGKTLNTKKPAEFEQYKKYQAEATQEVYANTVLDGVPLLEQEDIGLLDTFGGRVICLPLDIAKTIGFYIRWVVLFTILRQPYGEGEREYRTRQRLQMPERQWQSMAPEARADLVERELWLPENWDVYMAERKEEMEEERREVAQSSKYKQYKRWAKKNT